MAYKRIGDMLVAGGYLTEEKLKAGLAESRRTGKKLGETLVEMGFIRQSDLINVLENQLDVEYVDLQRMSLPKNLVSVIPRAIAKKYNVVPLASDANTVTIAIADPLNFVATDAVRAVTRRKVITRLADAQSITRALTDLYGSETAEKALEELRGDESAPSDFQSVADANIIGADNENAAPTIRLVNSFLEYAVNQNASDIHLEPREREMVVRMRIDGVLRKVFNVPRATQSAVIARIKVMGNMNIAEHKIPLDGRSNIRVNDKDVDLRISTLPTVYGEKVVIRLLNKSSSLLNTKGIGLTDKNLKKFNALLENSNGVILIVGPTGSGKSSSMYTMIGQLNTDEVNLVTLEDPVEYNFDGVNQVQINEKVGMTFANGLRSILRQDPDIISVGEIRDGETAEIAMRAAITGHLVLSTIHTSDAAATLDRLFDIGAALATEPESAWQPQLPGEKAITALEHAIDQVDATLPPLRQFVLPGGHPDAARANVARTVARRAERAIITLSQTATVDPVILQYINRLSDYLFALSRQININQNFDEIFWQKDC